jgi:hypothetical protein
MVKLKAILDALCLLARSIEISKGSVQLSPFPLVLPTRFELMFNFRQINSKTSFK